MGGKLRDNARVLITDDDQNIRWMLSLLLRSEGIEVIEAENGLVALSLVRQGNIDLMLLDLKMPGMTGLEVLHEVRKLDVGLPVVLITGFGTNEDAMIAGREGIRGFLTKPFKNDEIILTVRMALESRPRGLGIRDRASPLKRQILSELMGPSPAIQEINGRIQRVAGTDFTVMISGETGAGKEVVANAIHHLSQRCQGPFVPVDCGAISPSLIESELLGHEKGAFTGADRLHKGCFEAAEGGTLFLDEIGNLPLSMQSKLLRALQERRITRVGGTTPIDLNVRILCATNEDLGGLVEKGVFRRDLYYRLNEFDITILPLRERKGDIEFLARRFLGRVRTELKKPDCELTQEGVETLLAYPWPGNVRELQNLIRRAALLAENQIGPAELIRAGISSVSPSPSEANSEASDSLAANLHSEPALNPTDQRSFKDLVHDRVLEVEREILAQALKAASGNMKGAARFLQMDYKSIRTKIKFHHLTSLD